MNYAPQQYYYYPILYRSQQWQVIVGGVIDVLILVALGAWALSLVKKVFKGEEVKLI